VDGRFTLMGIDRRKRNMTQTLIDHCFADNGVNRWWRGDGCAACVEYRSPSEDLGRRGVPTYRRYGDITISCYCNRHCAMTAWHPVT